MDAVNACPAYRYSVNGKVFKVPKAFDKTQIEMKHLFFLLAMFLSFSAYSQLSEIENRALDKLISSKVEIEANALKAGVVQSVFDAAFFKVKTIPHYNNNGGYR